MLKRMSRNDEATIVFHECYRAAVATEELVCLLGSALNFTEESHNEGPIAP